MKEFVEKLIERLEEEKEIAEKEMEECIFKALPYHDSTEGKVIGIKKAIEIVNQLTEQHNNGWIEKLLEAKKNCGEDSDCSECPFGQIEDRCILAELQTNAENNGWIPVSDKLPDKDMRCLATFESGGIDKIPYLVTNNWGWNGEFADNKVVAWMPLPEPFKPKGE